jgi:phosphotransferase system enzyme I (PtsI)
MRIPALTGVQEARSKIQTGDKLIVDGMSGILFINPDKQIRREYERLEAELSGYRAGLQKGIDLPSVTLDGTAVPLFANASKVSDTEAAYLYRADGIGLYRTEFAFSIRSAFPTRRSSTSCSSAPPSACIRARSCCVCWTWAGTNNFPTFLCPRRATLRSRSVEFACCSRTPPVLKTQLRAFLRVSADHPVSVLLPVVGGLDEVRGARAVLAQVMAELTAQGIAFNPNIPVGAMIEIPSAATLTAVLAKELDFFSLGTNDLVQYLLAADREDDSVADYYQPLHPAVLRTIRFVADAAHAAGTAAHDLR